MAIGKVIVALLEHAHNNHLLVSKVALEEDHHLSVLKELHHL